MEDYSKRIDNKEALRKSVFVNFTDAVGCGTSEEFTEELYKRFTVEDFAYSDDVNYFTVEAYFNKVVIPHKINVYQAGLYLSRQDWFKELKIDSFAFLNNLWLHDLSKFSANEAFGYAFYNFKSGTNSDYRKKAFEAAWHHHKMNNPHHPEYWLNPNREGKLEVLPMPNIYIVEMIADWIGAGKTYGNELKDWAPSNVHKFLFHPTTEATVKDILDKLGVETEKKAKLPSLSANPLPSEGERHGF